MVVYALVLAIIFLRLRIAELKRAAKWTDETIDAMFVRGDRYIAVGTMRNMDAPVLIRLDSGRSFTGSVDKVATGILEVPSGVVEVSGSTDNGMSGGKVEVPPGTYRVDVQYFNLGSIAEDGLEGDDRYMITLTRADGRGLPG